MGSVLRRSHGGNGPDLLLILDRNRRLTQVFLTLLLCPDRQGVSAAARQAHDGGFFTLGLRRGDGERDVRGRSAGQF